jgi:hypothetical protein
MQSSVHTPLVHRAIVLWTVLLLLFADSSFAQSEDLGLFQKNEFGERYFLTAVGGLVLFLLIILFLFLRRRFTGDKTENMVSMTISDVGTLQKKGLLTDEESKAVRAALARQFTKQLESSNRQKAGLNSLLLDPEIRRLEAIAQEKAAKRELPPDVGANETETSVEAVNQNASGPDIMIGGTGPDFEHEAADSSATPPGIEILDSNDQVTPDDIQLPADVLSMAKLGLITADELERIKERARAKKRELDSL